MSTQHSTAQQAYELASILISVVSLATIRIAYVELGCDQVPCREVYRGHAEPGNSFDPNLNRPGFLESLMRTVRGMHAVMSLAGATFCITGTLSRVRRDIESLLRQHGADLSSTVSARTTHLICNDPNSKTSKVQKAKSLGISIVSEETVMLMIGVDAGTGAAAAAATEPVAAAVADIADGESVQVQGRDYVMKNVGGVYSCSCPGWRFQSKPIDVRTCKHLKELRGIAAEDARVGQTPTTSSPKRKQSPAGDATESNKAQKSDNTIEIGGLFQASNLMLAHSWKPDKNYTLSDFLISEKLDGMRALWDGQQLVSRQGNKIHAPDFFTAGFPSHMALDGELFRGRGQFQQTVSITRRLNGGEAWRDIQFVVFDAPSLSSQGFEDRLAAVFAIDSPFVVVHPHEPCRDQQHLEAELKRVEDLGGEGLMLRRSHSTYRFGRTEDLLKVKTFKDDEAIVYGHQPGKGRHNGRMGALLCRLRNNVEFKIGTGFSDEQRNDPPDIGSIVTFRYFEMTNAGVPRFPSYLRQRDDVDATEFLA